MIVLRLLSGVGLIWVLGGGVLSAEPDCSRPSTHFAARPGSFLFPLYQLETPAGIHILLTDGHATSFLAGSRLSQT